MTGLSALARSSLCRQAYAAGHRTEEVARRLAEQLEGADSSLLLLFAHHRLDLGLIADTLARSSDAQLVGCSTTGVISSGRPLAEERGASLEPSATVLALSRDWAKVGIGVASELGRNATANARAATHAAAAALGVRPDLLDPERHVGISLFDGRGGQEESFCVGSAGAAPQLKFVGGVAWAEPTVPNLVVGTRRLTDAGVVVLLDSERPFRAVSSVHVEPSALRCVVTASHGRRILELDGFPAVSRYRRLLAQLGAPDLPFEALVPGYPLAMYLGGTPYIRSIRAAQGEVLELTSAISSGQVLRVMSPGDLVGSTMQDLSTVAEALGGIELLLAFSCISRRRDAAIRNRQAELAATYGRYPVAGFDSHGEQYGMVLVNHTLSGLAIGGAG
ncbi:MAG: FIST C-terminal domain-containing protein [Myxococcales bacterium]|nr:FIST C-terminal domain-containing protein [Myxococcales bacterium]